MLFDKKKTKESRKRLDSAMLAINTMLRDIYSNKSSDEYKMKGDITKSPSYKQIEIMVADLKTLKGFEKRDADDIEKMFNTLHRPVFKAMVKEYIMEQNDRNTLFTATFTVGYRLLVGELTRIFASTEATDKGVVYKPNKVSRKADATRMIRLYNDNLENVLNKYVQDMKKYPEESPVNEAYLTILVDQMYQEQESRKDAVIPHDAKAAFESLAREKAKDSVKVDDFFGSDKDEKNDVKPVKEEADDTSADVDTTDTETDGGDDAVQEGAIAGAVAKTAAGMAGVTATLSDFGISVGIIATSVGIIAGLFRGVNALFRGFNPIADINSKLMNSYDKQIQKLSDVSRLYDETKRAYEEYMKTPDRKKRVENKYVKNLEKYNIQMQNLAAEIEHYNQRAQKESSELVDGIEKNLPNGDTKPSGDSGTSGNNNTDDDFQF